MSLSFYYTPPCISCLLYRLRFTSPSDREAVNGTYSLVAIERIQVWHSRVEWTIERYWRPWIVRWGFSAGSREGTLLR